jgi:oligopeptide/dipeptide ABC transporter ATP-binding protein
VTAIEAPRGGRPVEADVHTGPLLAVEHARIEFHPRRGFFGSVRVVALSDVSLELQRGETLAVAGESGSGKTTLGRSTLGLVPLSGGRIIFDGQDLSRLEGDAKRAFRARAQAVFQDPYGSLSPFMRVFDLVEEPLLVHGVDDRAEREARVNAALELVKLTPLDRYTRRFPHTLSGGQRQRINIARAMVLRPEYVVLDEPVSMIDASSRAEILSLLREIQLSSSLTFLYITHDLASARHFADRIAILYAGRIVELAGAQELVDNPLHPYAQALLAAVPEPDPSNRTRLRPVVGGEPPIPTQIPAGCPFHTRCPVAVAGRSETIEPPLIEVSAGHLVACHRYPDPLPG